MLLKEVFRVAFFSIFISVTFSLRSQCAEMNSQYLQSLLGDAIYNNFRVTQMEYAKDPYDINFEVDLLKNYTYKLVFDMSNKSEGIVVKLFDIGTKKLPIEPKLLYCSTENEMNENAAFEVSFDSPKTRMLVQYEVKDATYEGCVAFVLGVIKGSKQKRDRKIVEEQGEKERPELKVNFN